MSKKENSRSRARLKRLLSRKREYPTQDELGLIFRSGDKKQRMESVLIAHSGARPEVEGNYKGLDGSESRSSRNGDSKDGTVKFLKIPTIVIIRNELSKAGHEYFSFLSEEGCSYLKEYVEERLRKGEEADKGISGHYAKEDAKAFPSYE